MTTVCVRIGERRGEVAADRMLGYGNRHLPSRKIVRVTDRELGPVIFGGCGSWVQVLRVRRWLERGRRGRMPRMKSSAVMVVVIRSGQVEEWESVDGRLVRCVIERRFHAIGTGADAARGALYVGASARRAVLAAATVDKSTGDGVDVIRFVVPSQIS